MSITSYFFLGNKGLPETQFRSHYQKEDFSVEQPNASFRGEITDIKISDNYATYIVDQAVSVQTINHDLRGRVATFWSKANTLCQDVFIGTATSSIALLIAAGIAGSFVAMAGIVTAIVVGILGLVALGWAIFSAVRGKMAEGRCREWLNDSTLLKAVQDIRYNEGHDLPQKIVLNDPENKASDAVIVAAKRKKLRANDDELSIQKLLERINKEMKAVHS